MTDSLKKRATCSFVKSNLSELLTSIIKKEGMSK